MFVNRLLFYLRFHVIDKAECLGMRDIQFGPIMHMTHNYVQVDK